MENERKESKDPRVMTAQEVSDIYGCGKTKAYEIVQQLNRELAKKGKITVRGRVPRRYFEERTGLVEVSK